MSLLHTTQLLGLTTSLLLAGTNLSSSYLTIPLLLPLPVSTSTTFFKAFYLRGAYSLVPLGFFSGASSALASYLLYADGYPEKSRLWALAAVATLLHTPWTVLVMMGTNRRLVGIAESKVEQEKVSEGEVRGLLSRWAWLNVVRGSFALVGGVVGSWALLEEAK